MAAERFSEIRTAFFCSDPPAAISIKLNRIFRVVRNHARNTALPIHTPLIGNF
jgi:hypothetical protein